MSRALIWVSIFLMTVGACTKSSDSTYANSIIGKWKYTQRYYSAGGPLIYQPAELNQWVKFSQDGSIESNMSFFDNITGFELENESKIHFLTLSRPSGYMLYGYRIDTIEGGLNLYPLDPICIEGCGMLFKK